MDFQKNLGHVEHCRSSTFQNVLDSICRRKFKERGEGKKITLLLGGLMLSYTVPFFSGHWVVDKNCGPTAQSAFHFLIIVMDYAMLELVFLWDWRCISQHFEENKLKHLWSMLADKLEHICLCDNYVCYYCILPTKTVKLVLVHKENQMFLGCLQLNILGWKKLRVWLNFCGFHGQIFMVSSTLNFGSLVWTIIRPTPRNMHRQRKQLQSGGTIALL